MNRKIAVIVIGSSLILVTLVFVFYLQFKGRFEAISPVAKVTPTTIAEELSTWDDPAEFRFQYPKSLSLNPHNEDQTNYAHVELSSPSYPGNLIVWVKDTTAETVDAWITQQKIKNAIDSTLDAIPAKKVLAADSENKITLSTIRNGYLYQIEVSAVENDFWNRVFNQVISSFKFVSAVKDITNNEQPNYADTSDQGSDEIMSEGEEVIE